MMHARPLLRFLAHLMRLTCSLALLSSMAHAQTATHELTHHAARKQLLARLDAEPPHDDPDSEAACLSMIADDPDAAADNAADWERHGGADRAQRCAALAQVAQGDPRTGAARLGALSLDAQQPSARQALLAGEAARAWLLAGEPGSALAAAGRSRRLAPGIDATILYGRAALAAHRPGLAIHELSPLLALHPDQVEALTLRATALRQAGQPTPARADIDRACALAPDAPGPLLERGVLREAAGDLDGARADWGQVLSVSPDTQEADLAQQDLALLEAGPESR